MSQKLFTSIVRELTDNMFYFQQGIDCTKKVGISPLMKCTYEIRQLAYDIVLDALDEYLQIGDITSCDALDAICKRVMDAEEYFRMPTNNEVEKLYAFHEEKHGFLGMLGSIDWTKPRGVPRVPETPMKFFDLVLISTAMRDPQVVSAAKLSILNPNEFDLWKMRIEQYFLMTDYSLWERLARKNELKAHGTLLMVLPDKHQLKFNIHKDAKTLMEAIEKRFGGNKETKKKLISQLEIFGESLSQEDINLKFLRSLPTKWRTHTLIWRNKTDLEEQSLDDLFNSLKIYETKRTERNLGANRPTSMGFDMSKVECYNCHRKWHFARECSYDWSFQAEKEPTNYALMAFTSSSSSSSDNEIASCSKACTNQEKGVMLFLLPIQEHFMLPKPDLVFHDAPNVNETVHTTFNVELSPTKPDKDLSHTHSPSAPIIEVWVSDSEDDSEAELLQNAPSFVQPTEQEKSPRPSVKPIENSIPAANYKTVIPKPKSIGNSRNRKACFVCKSLTYLIKDYDYYEKQMVQNPARDHVKRGNNLHYAKMTHLNPQRHVVPTAVLTKSKLVPLTAARPVTTAILQSHATRPRPDKTVVTKPYSPPRRTINRRPSPPASNFPPKVNTAKAPKVNVVKCVQGNWGNPQHALKDKRVIDSGCSRHMTGNMSYLSDFEEINSGYVAFGGNPKGGKISGKGKIRTGKLDFDDVFFVKELKFNLFSVSQMYGKKNSVLFTDTKCIVLSFEFKLPDENQVLLRVPKENNMYNVDLKNIVPSGDLTCLFAKETLYESNLWHRRLGHINFKTMNELVKGKFDGKADDGFLVRYSISSKAFRVFNSRTRFVQKTLHINFLENKPNVVGSGPTWLFDIDTLTKSMNYQPVTAYNQSNPSASVQEQFDAEKSGEENVQQYVLFPLWSSGSKNPQNTDDDVAFEGKKPEFKGEKPESKVHVSPSSSAQTKKHDDKTKREAKGKSPVELSTGYRNFSVEFKDFFDNSINEVNVADTPVPDVGQISTNSTNTFSVTALEDITYSDDEEDVGAEADFTNLETNITDSLIPTTRVHKDHPVTQIIGDLSSATQTRSMTRVVQDQGGLSQINNEDFHTCMFACFLSQEEPNRVHQALKDPRFEDPDYPDKVYKVVKALYGLHQAPRAWYETLANYLLENSFQKGKIDQTLFIKKQKGDILVVQVKQKPDGIFISQDKYVAEILRKFGLTDGKSDSTPIDTDPYICN
nr:ribonuclease H-like domain-containing protein [Tanacetum cinerariifolium]